MPERAERHAAREAIAAYHEAELTALLSHVSLTLESLGGGELDAFDVDQVVFQYTRAAKELWKFCNASEIESLATFLAEGPRWVGGSAARFTNAEMGRSCRGANRLGSCPYFSDLNP